MQSRHLVDPELDSLLDIYQVLRPSADALPGIRAERSSAIHEFLRGLPPDTVEKTEHFAAANNGAPAVRILVYRPRQANRPLPVYLNVHGGGLVVGMPEQDEIANRRIVNEIGCVVVAPAYRLAPETTFPGPLEDCCAALNWVVTNALELGADITRIAVGGPSAGGGLAAALALKVRDQGLIKLVALMLIFPMLDDRTGSTSEPSPFAGHFIWTAEQNRFGWSAYLGKPAGAASVEEYAVPARAEQVAGLPPSFLACGSLDLFIDENLEFSRRLIHAGVATELHVYPGAYHAFQFVAQAEVTRAFHTDFLRALRRAYRSVDTTPPAQ